MRLYAVVLCAIIGVVSCTGSGEAIVSTYRISPAFSVSTGAFSELGFAAISDVDFLEGGEIGILDRQLATLFVFSPVGEYLFSVGGKGSGPGEFNSPDCFVPISDDSILIYDKSIRRISVFNCQGDYLGDIEGMNQIQLPYWPLHLSENMFIGGILTIIGDGEKLETEYLVCRYTTELNLVDTLYSNIAPYEDGNISGTLNNTLFSCAFTSDSFGNMFISPVETDKMSIIGYDTALNQIVNVSEECSPIRKTEEDIALELERFTRMYSARNNVNSVDYTPSPNYQVIPPQGLHCDNNGNIWALSGSISPPTFSIIDYTGKIVAKVVIEGMDEEDTVDMLWWRICGYGILVFSVDPYSIPKVYYYALPVMS